MRLFAATLVGSCMALALGPISVYAAAGDFVNSATCDAGATPAVSTSFAVTSGNLVVVTVGGDNSTTNLVSSVSDSAGNFYSRVTSYETIHTGAGVVLDQWFVVATNTSVSTAVSIVFNDAATSLTCVVQQFSGPIASSPFDVKRVSTSTANSVFANSATSSATAQASELVVGGFVHAGTASAWTLGSGYTNLTQSNVALRSVMMQSLSTSSIGTFKATATIAAARGWIAGVSTFKLDTAAPTSTPATSTVSTCGFSTSTPCYNEIRYLDWLLVQLWIVFCLTFIPLDFFFKRIYPMRKGKV